VAIKCAPLLIGDKTTRWTSFVEPKARREKKLISATISTLRCCSGRRWS